MWWGILHGLVVETKKERGDCSLRSKVRAVIVGTSNSGGPLGKEVFRKEQMCITIVCIASTNYYDEFRVAVP